MTPMLHPQHLWHTQDTGSKTPKHLGLMIPAVARGCFWWISGNLLSDFGLRRAAALSSLTALLPRESNQVWKCPPHFLQHEEFQQISSRQTGKFGVHGTVIESSFFNFNNWSNIQLQSVLCRSAAKPLLFKVWSMDQQHLGITWETVRNEGPQAPHQTDRIRNCVLAKCTRWFEYTLKF